VAEVQRLHGALEVVHDAVLPREGLRLAVPDAARVPLPLLGRLLPVLRGVGQGREEGGLKSWPVAAYSCMVAQQGAR